MISLIMCIKRSSFRICLLGCLFFLSVFSCGDRFDKSKFLSACLISIDDNLLTDTEEYDEIYSGRWRNPKTDSLYRLFQKTHDHNLNLKICHSFGKGYFLRNMGRGLDSLLADNFFARAISTSVDRDEIIKLVLIYGWDKPYYVQKAIGEECLKEQYYVNDSLKYIALNYAIDGQYNQDIYNLDIIRDYCRERMRVAANVFGDDSPEAYHALFECAQFTQFANGKEVDVADSLFHFHMTHDKQYQHGRISDLYSDPLYLRYISSLVEGDVIYASEILGYLTKEVLNNQDDNKTLFESYAEAEILLMYENARLCYLLDDPTYKVWIDDAVNKSISFLSPTGGYVDIKDYLKPDHGFLSPLVDLMGLAYNTPSTEEAYNTALFIKGTSALIAPDLIRMLKSSGHEGLVSYVDSLRQNYRGHPFAGMGLAEYFEDPVVSAWIKRESFYEHELEDFISGVNPSIVWKHCFLKCDDVYKALSPGESAVEIIKTYPLAGGDEVYSALIINYGNPKPIRKELCGNQTLIQLIQNGHIYDNKPTPFYEQIVEPMLSAVTGDTVYLSSSGLFSLINIAFISKGYGVRISDERKIINCISTKAVCDERINDTNYFSSIALFGGMEFEKGNHTSHFSNENNVDRDVERDGFGFLPATLEEVETIDSIACCHNIKSYLYTGSNGTESEFRSFSGKAVSIIHLATHGFYYNTAETVSKGYINLLGNEENALNRCGLILADSQSTWKNGIDLYDNNNGILLGSEIANLDLLNTDLVVLAACNTGLGDISNEGISGLQQAFKRSGVRALLLSLKPISDDATKLFMVEFYNHLFAGDALQKSYDAAINRLMTHPVYSDPDYWSSYILLI